MPKVITSKSNATFKLCAQVLTGKGIREHGRALIAGPKIVREVLQSHPELVEAWITDAEGPEPPTFKNPLSHLSLSKSLYAELDVSGTASPLLLVRIPELQAWSDADAWPSGCTLFLPFQNPENIGAMIRTAVAFGVARIVLLRGAAHPFHPKAMRAGGSTIFRVPLFSGPAIEDLEVKQVPLLTLSAEGVDLQQAIFPKGSFGLLPGTEGPGLPDHLRQISMLRIPMVAGVESLNAATATAIALYVWRHPAPSC